MSHFAFRIPHFSKESEGCLVALAIFKIAVDPASAGPR